MSKLIIYCCPPTQRQDQEELGLKLVIPGKDYITGNCDLCGMQVWIGPEQRKNMIERPGPLHCFKCGTHPSLGRKNIISLGGEGARYIKQKKENTNATDTQQT